MIQSASTIGARAAPPPLAPLARHWRARLIWLLPVAAILLGASLLWGPLGSRGPLITIGFEAAEGLVPGSTRLRYRDIEVGTVESVRLAPELDQALVEVRVDPVLAPRLNDGSRFWIVDPTRQGAAGSRGGGDPAIAAAHIAMDLGKGQAASRFHGLGQPPLLRADLAGSRFELRARALGAITRGTPVLYRGLPVGEVLGYDLAEDDEQIIVQMLVRTSYDRLVHDGSRFWHIGAGSPAMAVDGAGTAPASLPAGAASAIGFDTPAGDRPAAPARVGQVFPLFGSFAAVTGAGYGATERMVAVFDGPVRGLAPGAPVEMRGLAIGRVTAVDLELASDAGQIRIVVDLELDPSRIALRTRDDPLRDNSPEAVRARVGQLIGQGLRAQLQTGNLVTGDLVVNLDFFPDAAPASLGTERGLPLLPTVPNRFDTLSASLTGMLDTVAALPLDELVFDLRRTVQAVERLATAPATQSLAGDLGLTLARLQALVEKLDTGIDPVGLGLKEALDQAAATLRDARSSFRAANDLVGEDSRLRFDLGTLLRELQTAARSFRVFADYLERHPEALLRGKVEGSR